MTGSHFSERGKEGKGVGELKELRRKGAEREGFSQWEGERDSISQERKGGSEKEGGIKWVIRGRD